MKLKIIFSTFLFFISSIVFSQHTANPSFEGKTWKAPYYLSIPEGWGVERFQIPISFAPKIDYQGIEDIRFAPGWSKNDNENYWGYAFLWYLDGDIKSPIKTVEENLKFYYTGLIAANGPNIPSEKLIPVTVLLKRGIDEKDDLESFVGTIELLDYMTQKPMVLNCKVHIRKCEAQNKTLVFYQLSPRLFTHHIWQSLDKLWTDFRCKQ